MVEVLNIEGHKYGRLKVLNKHRKNDDIRDLVYNPKAESYNFNEIANWIEENL